MSDSSAMAQELSVGMLDHSPVPVWATMYMLSKPLAVNMVTAADSTLEMRT